MRVNVLDLFCCPACEDRLDLRIAERANSEIVATSLVVPCEATYHDS
jgi:hypothetical protein